MKNSEISLNDVVISTDKSRMDVNGIQDFLSKYSDRSDIIPLERLDIAIENSLNFAPNKLMGYGRVISDYSMISYHIGLSILENYRGNHLLQCLTNQVIQRLILQWFRQWIFLTSKTDCFYKKYVLRSCGIRKFK